MRIVVIGTRGIPGILGGVETHCEELYPRLVEMGHEVIVIRRSPYIDESNRISEYRGVKLIDVYAPRRKSIEAIVHTTLAIIKAKSLRPDILHIHAIGPAIMTPLARLLGMKVVMTNHGPDYDRQKWGRLAKFVLKIGERLGTQFSNQVIVISNVIAHILRTNYRRTDTHLIYNGVNTPIKSTQTDYIDSLGIRPGSYILAIGRFVEEKGFHDLIDAYSQLKSESLQLVLAGDADHPDQYSTLLKEKARQAGAILTGFIKGEKLNQVMTNARLFAMPSYHEGLPIALLEAMSYNLDVVVSDIPACRLDNLTPDDHFPVGCVDALASALKAKLSQPHTPRSYDLSPYNWDIIAAQTAQLYQATIQPTD